MSIEPQSKQIEWMGSSLEALREFPEKVREEIGYALYLAQTGNKHISAKPLKGFTGAGVLEIVEDYDGDTYRAVYTVRLADRVYVLHAFQKKSKRGISTPQQDIDLIKERLKQAKSHHDLLSKKTKRGKDDPRNQGNNK